jgi:hypothetical protein
MFPSGASILYTSGEAIKDCDSPKIGAERAARPDEDIAPRSIAARSHRSSSASNVQREPVCIFFLTFDSIDLIYESHCDFLNRKI